jgi:hypothetical protein
VHLDREVEPVLCRGTDTDAQSALAARDRLETHDDAVVSEPLEFVEVVLKVLDRTYDDLDLVSVF